MTLFPTDLPRLAWAQFAAQGFAAPVCGVVFRTDAPPCCGVPLGGIGTGCIDIDSRGIYGWSSLFNPVGEHPLGPYWNPPRKLPKVEAILGLSVGGRTWVLAARETISGGSIGWCTEPHGVGGVGKVVPITLPCPLLPDVEPAREIHYWGHYPVADLEYETDAPVQVGMRAWSPFIPGDTGASGIPAAVFEVRLRNTTARAQQGTLAFNFPGPDEQEAQGAVLTRAERARAPRGIHVRSAGGVGYFLGAIADGTLRFGTGLHADPRSWSGIAHALPQANPLTASSCSAAVDFILAAGKETAARFILSWYAPERQGQKRKPASQAPGKDEPGMRSVWVGSEPEGASHFFTAMYAARYRDAVEVAERMAAEHETLLGRILSWQAAVYGEGPIPAWLRDSLINNLGLIAEDSLWVQARPPLGDWAHPQGVFGLTESPRACPTTANIPCDWYGNLPIVWFFPELARSTLRAFHHYQTEEGEIPFALGAIDVPDFATPGYFWQVSLNGFCYADLVDRLWLSTGDRHVLVEFYDSVKRCTVYTMKLSRPPAAAIRMPAVGGMEWFEWGEWAGWTAHAGGLRLAWLLMVRRMAEEMGDARFASQCGAWFDEGSQAMEREMWTGSYYLNFREPETGKISDDVMGYQLDAEWVTRYHGLPGVFRPDRAAVTLRTIERCNMALTPNIGAANFARPDGSPLPTDSKVAYYGAYAMFNAELLILAFTFIDAGQKDRGLELAHRFWENLALRQRHPWDLPNLVDGKTGKRHFGTDYYQNMLLWALPEVLAGRSIAQARDPAGLIQRVLEAGRARR